MSLKRNWLLILAVVVAAVAVAYSQTSVVGSSLGFAAGPGNTCSAPQTGMTYLCGTTAGVQISVNGAVYVPVQGTPGPAGPQGSTGPQGPQGVPGPQGPAGTVPSTLTCTTMTVASSGIVLSGCH